MTPTFRRTLTCLALAAIAQGVFAETAPPFIQDARGCAVFDPNPQAGATITWSGGCKDGFADGAGTVQWRHGDVLGASYSGTMAAGKPSGQGIETFQNGSRYEGMFANGRRNGHGVATWPGGLRYDGDFADGKRQGHGRFDFGGGLRYDGAFDHDDMTGPATIEFLGMRLEGAFTRGQLSGPGVLVRPAAGGERRLPVDAGPAPVAEVHLPAGSDASGVAHMRDEADVRHCRPEYPPLALRVSAMGTTRLAVFVDAQGQTLRARIVHPSGADFAHSLLDLSALAAFADCPMVAAQVDNQPVAGWTHIYYTWKLE